MMTNDAFAGEIPDAGFMQRQVDRHLENERRTDPLRLEERAATHVRLAQFLESVAAACVACDLLFLRFAPKSFSAWVAIAGLVFAVVPAVLFQAWFAREIAAALRERAAASQSDQRASARKDFAAMTELYLSRQRIMVLRDRGASRDVCSALLSILRSGAPEPQRYTGSALLGQLDPLLGRARTDEVLAQLSAALAL
jgi:uncharacterized membrane protein